MKRSRIWVFAVMLAPSLAFADHAIVFNSGDDGEGCIFTLVNEKTGESCTSYDPTVSKATLVLLDGPNGPTATLVCHSQCSEPQTATSRIEFQETFLGSPAVCKVTIAKSGVVNGTCQTL